MAAIKKLMDTVEVNGLAFSPAEPAMGLIYQRLFERLGKEFVRVASSYYVRRTYLQELLSKMGESTAKPEFIPKFSQPHAIAEQKKNKCVTTN
jgi:hypothetical protein